MLGMTRRGETLVKTLGISTKPARFLGPLLAGFVLSCGAQTGSRSPVNAVRPGPNGANASESVGPVASDGAPGGFDITVRNLNILHGVHCVGQCRLAERLDLAFRWLTRGACPDVITLQEVSTTARPLIVEALRGVASSCSFEYEDVYEQVNAFDDAMILSRYPVLERGVASLDGAFRHVLYARIAHPAGPVDVFTTHLASISDLGMLSCGNACAKECVAAGARTRRECQAVKAAAFVEAHAGDRAIVTGDFNAQPDDFEMRYFAALGFEDTYSVAGNPECEPTTGIGCSSGRGGSQDILEEPFIRQDERIDYVLVRARADSCAIESAGDPDADGVATGALAHESNPFAASCGEFPAPPCWPSDHAGVELDWRCRGERTVPQWSASRRNPGSKGADSASD